MSVELPTEMATEQADLELVARQRLARVTFLFDRERREGGHGSRIGEVDEGVYGRERGLG